MTKQRTLFLKRTTRSNSKTTKTVCPSKFSKFFFISHLDKILNIVKKRIREGSMGLPVRFSSQGVQMPG